MANPYVSVANPFGPSVKQEPGAFGAAPSTGSLLGPSVNTTANLGLSSSSTANAATANSGDVTMGTGSLLNPTPAGATRSGAAAAPTSSLDATALEEPPKKKQKTRRVQNKLEQRHLLSDTTGIPSLYDRIDSGVTKCS
jgi:hypothetical protein